MVTRRPTRRETAYSNTLEGVRMVVFKREVLVPHPDQRYSNSRFGIELADERGAGESYEAAYARLEMAGNDILAKRIYSYVHGITIPFDSSIRAIKEQYGL